MATAYLRELQEENSNIDKFLREMGEYPPPIPDTVIMHILAEAGLSTGDPRVHRTLNVACQKFINDVLESCVAIARRRAKSDKDHKNLAAKKTVDIQVSDLKEALGNVGIQVHRPEFIVSIPNSSHEE